MRRFCLCVTILIAVGQAGCGMKAPPVAAPGVPPAIVATEEKPGFSESQLSFSGMSMLLIPAPLNEGAERVSAEEVVKRLFPGVAEDEVSRELLNKLFDGKVELEPHLDDHTKPGDKETPPKEDYTVSLRGNLFLDDLDPTAPQDGRRSGYFAAARFSRVPAQTIRLEDLGKRFDAQPNDVQSLILTCNDYLLRKLPGWVLIDGRGANDVFSYEAPTTSPDERRAELDGQIATYLKRFAAPTKE